MCQSYCRYFQSAIRFYFSRFNTYKLSLNFSLGVNKSFFNFNIRSSKAHTQVYLCFNQHVSIKFNFKQIFNDEEKCNNY